jgi:phosphoribosylformylglycinamidine synthase
MIFGPRQNPRDCYNLFPFGVAWQKLSPPGPCEQHTMKAHVWVMLKSTVLDPQGQTIQRALSSLGYAKVQDVRQGKFFVLQLDGLSQDEAKAQVERIAKDVLTNPVIEEFRYEILG